MGCNASHDGCRKHGMRCTLHANVGHLAPRELAERCHGHAVDVDEGEEAKAPAEVFRAAITTKTDALTREGEVVLASLDNVSALYPRGRYELSLFPAFMDMDGPNHQYKIRCAALLQRNTAPISQLLYHQYKIRCAVLLQRI